MLGPGKCQDIERLLVLAVVVVSEGETDGEGEGEGKGNSAMVKAGALHSPPKQLRALTGLGEGKESSHATGVVRRDDGAVAGRVVARVAGCSLGSFRCGRDVGSRAAFVWNKFEMTERKKFVPLIYRSGRYTYVRGRYARRLS